MRKALAELSNDTPSDLLGRLVLLFLFCKSIQENICWEKIHLTHATDLSLISSSIFGAV